mgnify:CR=1 FL=1
MYVRVPGEEPRLPRWLLIELQFRDCCDRLFSELFEGVERG